MNTPLESLKRAGATRPPMLMPLAAALFACLGASGAHAQGAAASTETVLSPVKVEATGEAAQDGYRATATRVGKTLQDPHDVPQAVTTVTNKLMEEQQVGSLREAMRNVSGVSFNAAEGGRSGDNMNLRGFYTFGDMYLDGIRDTAQYNRETFNLEQVDVLRGAGAMLFGRGQAGGVINLVSKTPLPFDTNKVTGSLGNNEYREVTGDFNKRLGQHTAVRLNVMKRDEGSWRRNPANGDEPEIHREGIGLSLGLNLYTDSQFWLNHYYLRTRDIPDYGISFDASTRKPNKRFASKTYWGTDQNFDDSDTHITTLAHEYRFSADTQLRTQLRNADYQRTYWAKTPNLTAAPSATGVVGGNQTRTSDYNTLTLQSDFSTRFQLAGMRHEMIAGLEWLKEDSFRHTLRNFGGTTAANPPLFLPDQAALTGNPVKFQGDSYAVYLQDTIEFIPRWKATLGARRDYMSAEYSSATSPELSYGEMSYRGALSFHPAADTHYYVAWSDSFSPTADLYQLTVAPLPPERSQVAELGAKWLLLDGDLALRTALYRADKSWERNTDLESTAAILTRKRRTDGFEVEAAGRITESWEVFAGLALMDAKIRKVARNVNPNTGVITSANPAYEGERARNTPRYTANLWTTYKLPGGWKLGGGAEAKGDRYAYGPNGTGPIPTLPGSTKFHPNTAPAYVRWDAMAAYEQRTWAVRLNVKNVFDKVYYDAVYDSGGFTVPGTRRAVILSSEIKF